MFATSGRLMSSILRWTFRDAPCRFRLRPDGLPRRSPPAPPHSTRCSWARISTLPKIGPRLLERSRAVSRNRIWREPIALIDVFAVPTAGDCLDDSRRLAAVHFKCFIEVGARGVILETLVDANVVGEFSAEIVVQAAFC